MLKAEVKKLTDEEQHLENRRHELQQQIEKISKTMADGGILDRLADFRTTFDSLTPEGKKLLIRSFVEVAVKINAKDTVRDKGALPSAAPDRDRRQARGTRRRGGQSMSTVDKASVYLRISKGDPKRQKSVGDQLDEARKFAKSEGIEGVEVVDEAILHGRGHLRADGRGPA